MSRPKLKFKKETIRSLTPWEKKHLLLRGDEDEFPEACLQVIGRFLRTARERPRDYAPPHYTLQRLAMVRHRIRASIQKKDGSIWRALADLIESRFYGDSNKDRRIEIVDWFTWWEDEVKSGYTAIDAAIAAEIGVITDERTIKSAGLPPTMKQMLDVLTAQGLFPKDYTRAQCRDMLKGDLKYLGLRASDLKNYLKQWGASVPESGTTGVNNNPSLPPIPVSPTVFNRVLNEKRERKSRSVRRRHPRAGHVSTSKKRARRSFLRRNANVLE
jgi:hypothetical protein